MEDDYVCCFTILNAMTNALFNVFHKYTTSLELQHAIQHRYVNQDADHRSFLISKYIDFKIDDTWSIINQVNDLNDIDTERANAGEPILETIQVSTIIVNFHLCRKITNEF